jgi:hypothetical protein
MGERARDRMLRQEIKKGCKYLGKEGKGFGQSFIVLMFDMGMGPQDLLLYEKRIVIWFGDGIQQVNWLGNFQYPVNSVELLTTFFFCNLWR